VKQEAHLQHVQKVVDVDNVVRCANVEAVRMAKVLQQRCARAVKRFFAKETAATHNGRLALAKLAVQYGLERFLLEPRTQRKITIQAFVQHKENLIGRWAVDGRLQGG
jgi:hypothetical protein